MACPGGFRGLSLPSRELSPVSRISCCRFCLLASSFSPHAGSVLVSAPPLSGALGPRSLGPGVATLPVLATGHRACLRSHDTASRWHPRWRSADRGRRCRGGAETPPNHLQHRGPALGDERTACRSRRERARPVRTLKDRARPLRTLKDRGRWREACSGGLSHGLNTNRATVRHPWAPNLKGRTRKTTGKVTGKSTRQLLFSEALQQQKHPSVEDSPPLPCANMTEDIQGATMDRILQEISAVSRKLEGMDNAMVALTAEIYAAGTSRFSIADVRA
ncbi:hypothetical protein NDU88_004258 [Pleurodeles waltl]|uniref:Uncharacterized protein n=1 Tax=Pleurodeles waltl TaxID=8319 RepID=A0AAV7SIA0_PLEWA|nr:hypothetical protein NDU88_004258 [Pleurodeles waltl]